MTILAEQEYHFEFIVLANDRDAAIKVMRDELGITQKKSTNDREIDGYFLFKTKVQRQDIINEFYKKVRESTNVAIVEDEVTEELRDLVLKEVRLVEDQLRRLLLHVSDVVENYHTLFLKAADAKNDAQKERTIPHNNLDPITSRLTLDEMIVILKLDTSWKNKNIGSEDLHTLIGESENFEQLKKTFDIKMIEKTVWEVISEHVLINPVSWQDIKEDLNRIKSIRNKAAHYKTLTPNNYKNVQLLSKRVLGKIKNQKTLTKSQSDSLSKAMHSMEKSLQHAVKLSEATMMNKVEMDKMFDSIKLPEIDTSTLNTAIEKFRRTQDRFGKIGHDMSHFFGDQTNENENGNDLDDNKKDGHEDDEQQGSDNTEESDE